MEKEQFWNYVTSFNSGHDESGWAGIQNQIKMVVRNRFPNVEEFDWDAIEIKAIEHAMKDYDPARSGIATWICWWAQSAAYKLLKRSCRYPAPLPFSAFESEDEESPLDNLGFLDKYNEFSAAHEDVIGQTVNTDLSIMMGHKGIIGYTVGDLISDTIDGLSSADIGKKVGLSYKTIDRAKAELERRWKILGIHDEIVARVSEQDKRSLDYAVQYVEGEKQETEGVPDDWDRPDLLEEDAGD